MGAGSPKFYGLPKVHKQGTPFEAHSLQHWGSYLPNSKGAIKNPETPGGKIKASYPEQPGLPRRSEEYPRYLQMKS